MKKELKKSKPLEKVEEEYHSTTFVGKGAARLLGMWPAEKVEEVRINKDIIDAGMEVDTYFDNFLCTCNSSYLDKVCPDGVRLKSFIYSLLEQQRQYTAQECYLEALAVGCGESEFSEAIKSKFNLK